MGRAFDRAEFVAAPKNYVINGAMQVSQQNGTTPGSTSPYYPADMWRLEYACAGVVSAGQVVSVTPLGSPNRMRMTVTTPDAAMGAGDYVVMVYRFEGSRVADLLFGYGGAKSIVLKFGCRAPAGTYGISFQNGNQTRIYLAEFTVAPGEANLDTYKTITVPGDITGTWPVDNTLGMVIDFCLMGGTTWQAAAGAWRAGPNVFTTANQFNFMGTNGNIFELFDVGLYAVGTVPSQFVMTDYLNELLLCKRYYEQVGMTLVTLVTPYHNASWFRATKRTTPTLTLIGGSFNGATVGAVLLDTTNGMRQLTAASSAIDVMFAVEARL